MFSSWFKTRSSSSSSSAPSSQHEPPAPYHARSASGAAANRWSDRTNGSGRGVENQDAGYDEATLSSATDASQQLPAASCTRTSASSSSSYPPSAADTSSLSASSLASTSSTGYPSLRATFDRLNHLLLPRAPALRDSLAPGMNPLTSPAYLSLVASLSARELQLPRAVLDAYLLHDGQDDSAAGDASKGGLVYGLWWMSMEEVVNEWRVWRSFEDRGGRSGMKDAFTLGDERSGSERRREERRKGSFEGKRNGGASIGVNGRGKGKGRQTDSGVTLGALEELANEEDGIRGGEEGLASQAFVDHDDEEEEMHRYDFEQEGMRSYPNGWVRNKYSHPGWIPLLTDRAGNYIGVDLDPPTSLFSTDRKNGVAVHDLTESRGQSGQVIAFGREIDEKVVLFPGHTQGGWGRFLSSFVDDLERGEFARLGSNRGSSSPSSTTKAAHSDDEDWDDGDGLGDRGYLEGARYGDEEAGRQEGDDGRVWTLRSEWRRWTVHHVDQGGLIGALAERSRRRWKEMGIGLPKQLSNFSSPISSKPSLVPHLSLFVPTSTSSIIITVDSESAVDLQDSAMPTSPAATSVSLILSPPSPKVARFDGIPSPPANGSSSSSSSSGGEQRESVPDTPNRHSSSSLVAPSSLSPSPRKSRRSYDDKSSTSASSLQFPSHRGASSPSSGRRRAIPPPPAVFALDLPTMLDMVSFGQQEEEARMRRLGGAGGRGGKNSFDAPASLSTSASSSPRLSLSNIVRTVVDSATGVSHSAAAGAGDGGEFEGNLLPLSISNSRNNSRTALVEQDAIELDVAGLVIERVEEREGRLNADEEKNRRGGLTSDLPY